MADILYFGTLPHEQKLSEILGESGHKLVASRCADELDPIQQYEAVIVEWNSSADSVALRKTKEANLPSIVISDCIVAAFKAGEPYADLYLEKPVDPLELVTLLQEMIRACQALRLAKEAQQVGEADGVLT